MQRKLMNVQTAMSAIDRLLYADANYPKEKKIDLIALLAMKKDGKDQEIVECLWEMIKDPEVLTKIFGLPEGSRSVFLEKIYWRLGLPQQAG